MCICLTEIYILPLFLADNLHFWQGGLFTCPKTFQHLFPLWQDWTFCQQIIIEDDYWKGALWHFQAQRGIFLISIIFWWKRKQIYSNQDGDALCIASDRMSVSCLHETAPLLLSSLIFCFLQLLIESPVSSSPVFSHFPRNSSSPPVFFHILFLARPDWIPCFHLPWFLLFSTK